MTDEQLIEQWQALGDRLWKEDPQSFINARKELATLAGIVLGEIPLDDWAKIGAALAASPDTRHEIADRVEYYATIEGARREASGFVVRGSCGPSN